MKKRKDIIIAITETAIFVALAIVFELLSKIIGLSLPQGGSISLTMLPLLIISIRRGVGYGLVAGLIFGIVNFFLDGFYWHWGSIFFDYLFAFPVLGLAGLFRKKVVKSSNYLIPAFSLAVFMRFLFSFLSVVIFFSIYAPEGYLSKYGELFGAIIYSIVYNGSYLILSLLLCLIIAFAIYPVIFYKIDLETIKK